MSAITPTTPVFAVAVLGVLPLLLIAALALVAVFSDNQSRQVNARKTLYRLLITLRPREASAQPLRRRTPAASVR